MRACARDRKRETETEREREVKSVPDVLPVAFLICINIEHCTLESHMQGMRVRLVPYLKRILYRKCLGREVVQLSDFVRF